METPGESERSEKQAEFSVLGFTSEFEKRHLWTELEEEVSSYHKKNASMKVQLNDINKDMWKCITDYEELIKGITDIAQCLYADGEAAQTRFDIQQDENIQRLTSVYARVSKVLIKQQQVTTELTKDVVTVKACFARNAGIVEEMAAIDIRCRADATSQRTAVCALKFKEHTSGVRSEHAAMNQEQMNRTNLMGEIKLGMSDKFHVVQTEHGCVVAELRCQANHMNQLLAANLWLQRRKRKLDFSIDEERKNQGYILRSIMSRGIRSKSTNTGR